MDASRRQAGSSHLRGVWLAAAVLVLARSAVWVFWEQSHFDSDQAVWGLMAKHVAELRAFPLVFYGQHYMMAVESWITAPVFKVFGASVTTLKLPLVAINIVVAALLLRILVRDAGVSRGAALVASLFFLLPPPAASSRLVEAAGGGIEPFLYILLLWTMRERPVAFGLVAGLGFMNREFTAYGIAALVLLEAWHGALFTRASLRAKAIIGAEMLAVMFAVRLLMPHADLVGPGTEGTLPPEALNGQMAFLVSRFCVSASALLPNLTWLFRDNLGTLFGWRVEPLAVYVRSGLTAGHTWAFVPLAALAAGAVWVTAASSDAVSPPAPAAAGTPRVPGRAFPAYAVAVGLMTIGAYALTSCLVQDRMLIRYTLLAIFIPIGAAATLLRSGRRPFVRGAAASAILIWAAASASDDARVLFEYVRHPPRNEYRQFADFLEREGIWYGQAPYWTAYQIDFLTRERVTMGSFEKVRVSEYEDIVHAHTNESIAVFVDDPCTDEGAVVFGRFCMLYVPRALHPQPRRQE